MDPEKQRSCDTTVTNTAVHVELQHSITSRCSGKEPALLPGKQEKLVTSDERMTFSKLETNEKKNAIDRFEKKDINLYFLIQTSHTSDHVGCLLLGR